MRARSILAAALLAIAGAACADGGTYKSVDASGSVVYSDRRSDGQDIRVKNWMPSPGNYAYTEALQRAQADRAYEARLQYERRLRPPIVVYDPLRWRAEREGQASQPGYGYAPGYSGRRDFNLPDIPAPSLDRNYYYNGR